MKRMFSLALVGLAAVIVVAPTSAAAQTERLQIHGYLTQAWGKADGGTFTGIPEGGTSDYRNLALQFRYAITGDDQLTIQFSHRRLGENPMVAGEQDVQLDWAYYGANLGNFNVRVGRIPIPAGIYNELRDVGVALPLYRAPYNMYLEGAFTSETVDGIVGRYIADAGSWSAEVSGYYGNFNMVNRVDLNGQYQAIPVAVQNAMGAQLWVNTPVDGVRFGGGASQQEINNGPFLGTWKSWHASADVSLSRVTARAEYRSFDLPILDYVAYYGYVGLHVTEQLTLHGQADFADFTYIGLSQTDFNDAYTAGVSYAFRPNLVLKAEMHSTNGFWADSPVLDPTADTPVSVRYAIVSLSTAF